MFEYKFVEAKNSKDAELVMNKYELIPKTCTLL